MTPTIATKLNLLEDLNSCRNTIKLLTLLLNSFHIKSAESSHDKIANYIDDTFCYGCDRKYGNCYCEFHYDVYDYEQEEDHEEVLLEEPEMTDE
jgi:hypothetical protein